MHKEQTVSGFCNRRDSLHFVFLVFKDMDQTGFEVFFSKVSYRNPEPASPLCLSNSMDDMDQVRAGR